MSFQNSLLFLNHNNKMNQLLDEIKNEKELSQYIIQILHNVDLELSKYIYDYINLEVNNQENNIIYDENDADAEGTGNDENDADAEGTGNNNINDNTELNIEKITDEEEGNNIIDETINNDISTVDDFDSYIDSLDDDKNTISIIKTTDNDRFIVQATDFPFNKNKVDPSVKIFTKCLNKDILYKTSMTRMSRLQLTNIEYILRDETVMILYSVME